MQRLHLFLIHYFIEPYLNADAVAGAGFPRGGGANSKGGCEKLLFGQFFPKNCMKLKEFGPQGGGARPWRPP